MPQAPLVLDTVIEGIFHQGLQGQLQDRIVIELLRNLDGILQDISVTELLNLQVAADMGLLLLDTDVIPALA